MEEFSRFVWVNTYYNKMSFERSYIQPTQQTTGSWDMSLWELPSLYVDKRYWEFLFFSMDETMGNSTIHVFRGLIFLVWPIGTDLLYYSELFTYVFDIDMQHIVKVCKSRLPLFAVLACFSNSSFLVLLMLNYKSSSQQQIHFFWWLGCGWNGLSNVSDDWGEWLSC